MNVIAQVDVLSGHKGFYRFSVKTVSPNTVVIETGTRGREDGLIDHYHQFRVGDDRGAAAIKALVEDCARYKRFFEAACKIGVTELHSGRLEGFMERSDADEGEFEDAYDVVAEMIEERVCEEDIAAGFRYE